MKTFTVGTTLVLPGAETVMGILERAEHFALQPGNELFQEMLELKIPRGDVFGINRISVANLVVALYLDQLQATSKWLPERNAHEHYELEMYKLVEGWRDLTTAQQKAFFSEVVQCAYEDVHDWVLNFDDGQASWHIWYVRRVGLDVIIEKGPDFRIVDWERRMAMAVEHKKLADEGEPLPEGAWLPDEDAMLFVQRQVEKELEAQVATKAVGEAINNRRRQLASRRRRSGKGAL